MESRRYYRPHDDAAVQAIEAIEAGRKGVSRACRISRRVGGSRSKVLTTHDLMRGGTRIVGIVFGKGKTPEPESAWKRLKTEHNAWWPKKQKRNEKLLAELNECHGKESDVLIGLFLPKANPTFNAKGVRFPAVGYARNGDRLLLSIAGCWEPVNCERVSDVEWDSFMGDIESSKAKRGPTNAN